MPSSLLTHLRALVVTASEPHVGVTWRRMFGCDAAFVRDQIFALIWKTGRIGLRLPDPQAHAELLTLDGADVWAPGGTAMKHWALLPEELHDSEEDLARWVTRAHALALTAPPKPTKPAKPAAAKAPPKPAKAKKVTATAKPPKSTAPAKTPKATATAKPPKSPKPPRAPASGSRRPSAPA